MNSDASRAIGQQLIDVGPLLDQLAEDIFSSESAPQKRVQAVNHYSTNLRRLSLSAVMLELEAIADITDFAERNVSALNTAKTDTPENGELKSLIGNWHLVLGKTLGGVQPQSQSASLKSVLESHHWPLPLDESEAIALIEQIHPLGIVDEIAAYNEQLDEESVEELDEDSKIDHSADVMTDVVSGTVAAGIQQRNESPQKTDTGQTVIDSSPDAAKIVENEKVTEADSASESSETITPEDLLIAQAELDADLKQAVLTDTSEELVAPVHSSELDDLPATANAEIPVFDDLTQTQTISDPDSQAESVVATLLSLEGETDGQILDVEPEVQDHVETSAITVEQSGFVFPDDLNDFIAEAFMEEVVDQSVEFSTSMRLLASGQGDDENLGLGRRIAHTIKGSAAISGLSGLSDLMHKAEDILEFLLESKQPCPSPLKDTLVYTSDCLQGIVGFLQDQQDLPNTISSANERLSYWQKTLYEGDTDLVSQNDAVVTSPPLQPLQSEPNRQSDQLHDPDDGAEANNSYLDEQILGLDPLDGNVGDGVDKNTSSDLSEEDVLVDNTTETFTESDSADDVEDDSAKTIETFAENDGLITTSVDVIEPLESTGFTPDVEEDDVDSSSINTQIEPVVDGENITSVHDSENGVDLSPATADTTQGLNFPPDINPIIVEAFMEEVPQRTAEFSESMRALANGEGGEENLLHAQRLAHTIKGSSAIAGVTGIADIMHQAEDVLELLVESRSEPMPELTESLVNVADCLEEIVESLLGSGLAPTNTVAIIENLRDWPRRLFELDSVSSDGRDGEKLRDNQSQDSLLSDDVATDSHADFTTTTTTSAAQREDIKTASGAVNVSSASRGLRVRSETVDELLRHAGEISISTVQLQGFNEQIHSRLKTLMEQNELVQARMDALNELVHIRGVPAMNQAFGGGGVGSNVDFDPLELDQYSELHSASNSLTETLVDASVISKSVMADLGRFDDLLTLQSRTTKALTDSVLTARLVPILSIEPRLQRIVRQTCRATGKSAELVVSGSNLQIDSNILNSITDALLHLLRNAIAHGIELPQVREDINKPSKGSIELSFQQTGDLLKIQCKDDGAGYNFEKIRKIAEQRGLIETDAPINEDELVRLTWLPGFSTHDETTEIAGRGIGANVIQRQVIQQRGIIDVDSVAGRGSTISISLPLTLISVHTMLITAGGQTYGVPSTSVEQMIFSDAGTIEENAEKTVFVIAGREYRVEYLSQLIGSSSPIQKNIKDDTVPLFLLHADVGNVAVVFDQALDGRSLVIKKLGEYLPRVRGVVGATVLADGSIATILDLRELLQTEVHYHTELEQKVSVHSDPTTDTPATVLVVDDSLSARRAIAHLVSEAGFETRTAIDGLDAIDEIDKEMPSIVMLDMEMPRMTGLEVTMHLRANPDTLNLPVIMVTSRSTEKHRQQALAVGVNAFVTKPYNEQQIVSEINRLLSI